jgi:hypothetical protein
VNRTVFGDLRARASAVYRVQTQASVYIVGVHEARGKKFVIVRGQPGTDRELVVVRDGDPRIGDRSLFEVPLREWIGQVLEVATMTSSPIVSAVEERAPEAIAAVAVDGHLERSPWARPSPDDLAAGPVQVPRPPGFPESPRIVPSNAKGTHPALGKQGPLARDAVARDVVVGKGMRKASEGAAEPPYPLRHVLYAENITALLRSIHRRDRLYADVDPVQRERLRTALDDAAALLEQIRRRDRK